MTTLVEPLTEENRKRWELILQDIDKDVVPVKFISKLILRLHDRKQRTINIERMFDQGLSAREVELIITKYFVELNKKVVKVEMELHVQNIAETVQPQVDRLLAGL